MTIRRAGMVCVLCLLLCVPTAFARSYALNGESYGVLVDSDGAELVGPGEYGNIFQLGTDGRLFGAQSLTARAEHTYDGETYYAPLSCILDEKGNPLTECLYEQMQYVPETNVVIVVRDDLYGVVDASGKELIPCKFNGLSPNGAGGYISCDAPLYDGEAGDLLLVDANGQVQKTGARAFNSLWTFVGGLATASAYREGTEDWCMGVLNADGTWAFAPQCETIGNYVGEYAAARVDGKWGLLDRSFQWALPARYEEILQYDPTPYGEDAAGDGAPYPILTYDGNDLITLRDAGTLKPLAMIRQENIRYLSFGDGYLVANTGEGFVVYDRDGARLFEIVGDGYISTYGTDATGLFTANLGEDDNSAYLLDKSGEKVAGPFANLWYMGPVGDTHYYQCGRTSAGRYFSGAIDANGAKRLEMVYDSLYWIGENRFIAVCGADWGLVDGTGHWLAQYSTYEELMD